MRRPATRSSRSIGSCAHTSREHGVYAQGATALNIWLGSRGDGNEAFVKDNGLTIALTAMFLLSLFGMVLTGRATFNQELTQHGARPIGLL